MSKMLDKVKEGESGRGLSSAQHDNIIPQLSVLQPLSPEVMDGPDAVEGAKAGDFLFGGSVIKGAKGVWFQPVAQAHRLFEFTPLDRGGGFVAEHAIPRDSAGRQAFVNGEPKMPDEVERGVGYERLFPNGNHLIHYRHWAGFLWLDKKTPTPCVIAFKSSGHTVARNWMTRASSLRLDGFPDKKLDLFSHVYHLTTAQRRNSKGQWYEINVGEHRALDPDRFPKVKEVVADPDAAYDEAERLDRDFSIGDKVAALPVSMSGKIQDEVAF
jgi:hypothetical protein